VCEYKIYLIQQNLPLIYQPCPVMCDDPANDNNKIINNLIMKFTNAHQHLNKLHTNYYFLNTTYFPFQSKIFISLEA
jgi:hypothetical protein